MNKKIIPFLLVFLLFAPSFSGAGEQAPVQSDMVVRGPQGAEQVNYQVMEDGRIVVSVTGADQQPLEGLTTMDFSIRRGNSNAEILDVIPIEDTRDVGLNIIMVVDNSFSMEDIKATQKLEKALAAFYQTLRPIDMVSAVVFDEQNTIDVDGRPLHARVIQTSDVAQLNNYIDQAITEGVTSGTYLYDAVLLGLHLAGQPPVQSAKHMTIFSDGEDINSIATPKEIELAAQQVDNLSVYAVDYMPTSEFDPFLARFSNSHSGQVWKSADAMALLPVLAQASSMPLYRYIVSYRFSKGVAPMAGASQLTIEKVTTVDSAPLLRHVYFETGESDLPDRYVQFRSRDEIARFDENRLKGAMEKHQQVLNIIGKRLRDNPNAAIQLVGCNDNVGVENKRTDLSGERAQTIKDYLVSAWGIDPRRIDVEARNLPETPTTNSIAKGQAENRRVDILADNSAILAPVNSVYLQNVSNLSELKILPELQAKSNVSNWQMNLLCGGKEIRTVQGSGEIPADWTIPLEATLLEEISDCPTVEMQVQTVDAQNNVMSTEQAYTLPVNYVERTETMGQVEGLSVQERYAFVLFDFDSADISGNNQLIVDSVAQRLNQIPDATISITGHSDDIGSPAYNRQLAERRAQAVGAAILSASDISPDRLNIKAVGPDAPLFTNDLPEGRALNRTVIVNLEYQKQ